MSQIDPQERREIAAMQTKIDAHLAEIEAIKAEVPESDAANWPKRPKSFKVQKWAEDLARFINETPEA